MNYGGLTRSGGVNVRAGMMVNALYKRKDWLYIKTPSEKSGFIPFANVAEHNTLWLQRLQNNHNKDSCAVVSGKQSDDSRSCGFDEGVWSRSSIQRSSDGSVINSDSSERFSSDETQNKQAKSYKQHIDEKSLNRLLCSEPDALQFIKQKSPQPQFPLSISPTQAKNVYPSSQFSNESMTVSVSSDDIIPSDVSFDGPLLTVMFDFMSHSKNEVTVWRYDNVMLLNDDDPDWIFVVCRDGRQGFIPRTYAVDCNALKIDHFSRTTYF